MLMAAAPMVHVGGFQVRNANMRHKRSAVCKTAVHPPYAQNSRTLSLGDEDLLLAVHLVAAASPANTAAQAGAMRKAYHHLHSAFCNFFTTQEQQHMLHRGALPGRTWLLAVMPHSMPMRMRRPL